MRLAIRHTTRYDFSLPLAQGLQRLRLKPKSTHGQKVIDWHMDLTGARREVEYEDQHGNAGLLISLEPGARSVTVTCTGTVETADNAGVLGMHTGYMPIWAFLAQTELTRPGPQMHALVAALEVEGQDAAGKGNGGTLAMLHALSDAVHNAAAYAPGRTAVDTPAEAALAAKVGVCQDHSHIFIGAARLLGIPARYISGYLLMDDRIDQEAGHGWAEAYVEGLGWVSFDVANEICTDARYVRVASGFDYRDAAPVTGISTGTGETAMAVSLSVEQVAAGL